MTELASQRELEILREVVELYLEKGEAVASGTVARVSATRLSPPSIRKVMADLEAKGCLEQPHTSAGRVPTELGFRLYLDWLVGRTPVLALKQRRRLRAMLAPPGPLEELMSQASRVLARVTDQVGIALTPEPQEAVLRAIHFVLVAPRRVLAILATQGGLVESRLLQVERDYEQAELDRVSNFCTQNFANRSLAEIRRRLARMMAEERAEWDGLFSGVLDLGRRAVAHEGAGGEVYLQGTERLLETMSPGQLEAVRRLFAAFADKALLLGLLDRYITGVGPRVVIGSELSLAAGSELGLIVTSFRLDTGERGLVGVIGPKRMDYPRIIPVVDFIGHVLAGESDEHEAG